MTPKDDLFRLIQSLTAKERQAFTIAAQGTKKEAPQYLKLFKAFCELDKYDEAAFLASKRGMSFQGNFHVRKKELYEKVFQVLRSQRQSAGSEKPMEFQVREYVEDARILRDKKLFDLSQQRLKHARTEAEKYQFHEIFLEILRMERTLVLDQQETNYRAKVEALHQEIEETIRIIHNKYRMLYLRDQLFLPSRQHIELADRLDQAALEKIMNNEELQNVALCLSFEAISNYHFCHAIFHHLQDNAEEAWIHFRTIYLMWQEQKGVQKIRAVEYRNMVQNYLTFCNDALRYEDFDIALTQLQQGPFHSDEEKAAAIQNSLYVRLQKHLNRCEWPSALALVDEYKSQLDLISQRMTPTRIMSYYLSFSRLFLVLEDPQKAASWARKVIGEGDGDNRQGLVFQARLQEIFALYDLQEVADLDKKCKTTIQSLKKTDSTFPKEIKTAQILNRIVGVQEPQKISQAFQEILNHLNANQAKHSANDRFTRAWVTSKLHNRNLRAVLEDGVK